MTLQHNEIVLLSALRMKIVQGAHSDIEEPQHSFHSLRLQCSEEPQSKERITRKGCPCFLRNSASCLSHARTDLNKALEKVTQLEKKRNLQLFQLFQLARSKEREHNNWNWNTEEAMNTINQGDWVTAIQSTACMSSRNPKRGVVVRRRCQAPESWWRCEDPLAQEHR